MKQLIIYFALAYIISWTIWLPMYGHIFRLTGLPILPFNHAIGGLGPLIASFLVTYIFNKKEGVKTLLKKCFQIKPLIYLLIALFSPFILIIVASLANLVINKASLNPLGLLAIKEFPEFKALTFFIFNLTFFGFGEEVGWRGFALPRLQMKFNALTSSLIITVFWAIWHLPLFFCIPGFTTMSIAGIFGWLFSLLTGSILLTWLYNSSKASILVCAVFHTTVDIVFSSEIADKNIINYMGFLMTIWGILSIIIFTPKNLATKNHQKPGLKKSFHKHEEGI